MKKLNLNKINLSGAEVLNRSQLKKVFGGANTSSICNSWQSNPATCFNCCITVKSMDECGNICH